MEQRSGKYVAKDARSKKFMVKIESTSTENEMKLIRLGLIIVLLSASGCLPKQTAREDAKGRAQKVVLGQVRIGDEETEFYIAYGPDEAILGFMVPDKTGGQRYFPMFASTYRGIPPVVLDIFASKAEDEMWVKSSWPGSEILAYRRTGADTAITQFGKVAALKEPMPSDLSGGGIPFPEMVMENVSKKATFTVKETR
jgi:hypothetical protein